MSVVAAQPAVPAILRPLMSFVLLLAMVGAFTSAARASTIGPTNDWVRLSEGVKQGMLSAAFADKILHAAVEATCPGHVYQVDGKPFEDGGTENGWFLGSYTGAYITGSDTGVFYSNAHLAVDQYDNLRQPLNQCFAQSFIDLVRTGSRNTNKFFIDPHSTSSKLGSPTPLRTSIKDVLGDRGEFVLLQFLAGAESLSIDTSVAGRLPVGSEVFMVSRRPNAFRGAAGGSRLEPLIQRCHVMKHYHDTGALPGSEALPGLVLTDCDNQEGDSGALYFVADPANPGDLIPVAMTTGNIESGENQPWSMGNTDVAISLDDNFFNFDHGFRLKDLPHQGN